MEEAYVSFELAKLLKEKGFDEPCRSYFISDSDEYRKCTVDITSKNCSSGQVLRPTHQMACAWLREKGFEIGVFYLFKAINPNVTVFDGYIPNVTQIIDGIYKDSWDMDVVKDYNNAVEAALEYSLKVLI